MTFERSEDAALIRAVVTHPAVWPHVSDDYAPQASAWTPAMHPSLWYVVVREGEDTLGLWMFEARGACWEVHTCLLPIAWGDRGKRAAREMAAWLWKNTTCRRLITNVPAYNRLALRFAQRAGMTEFGRNERSFLKHGELHDQILLGLSRPA